MPWRSRLPPMHARQLRWPVLLSELPIPPGRLSSTWLAGLLGSFHSEVQLTSVGSEHPVQKVLLAAMVLLI